MRFLLDTNVVSELIKPQPAESVMLWMAEAQEDAVFLSVVTLAEIKHGVERLEPGTRREALDKWVAEYLVERFQGRILPINERVADIWAKLLVRSERLGKRMGVMDAFQAACAELYSMALVTRDEAGFHGFSGQIVNPWR